ncbi:radical SAM protein [Herbivorax sp. ANBcel31]|uniref:SPL family radical SAM protein n=1 Tax=Herbivorax sp. ANBcel31 TaxID=3069754 RepID=UPI0027AE1C34|nr:radical SAM protein [Herbivorax sp. ANBcel31]MDQ2088036.1 radical SAM protein [Herbivorax sp. ANBcel31]
MINYADYKTILSSKNNMNIYRGCTHGCIYCDSRSECYGMTYTFENIEVKRNAVKLFDKELSKKRKKCMITTGAMTDPYIPLEKELENTRKCLEVIENHGFGVCLLTKSDLILRDIDILKRINQKSKCVVQVTLTTYDEDLCRIIEPNVCTTKRRFEVLKKMHEAGIPTVVWLTPILPFINDNCENILGILDYCEQAKITGLLNFGVGMTLRYGNREYYYKKLDEHFPDLKKKYMRRYGSSYGIKSPNNQRLTGIIKKFCKDNNIIFGKEVFSFCAHFPEKNQQITLFD